MRCTTLAWTKCWSWHAWSLASALQDSWWKALSPSADSARWLIQLSLTGGREASLLQAPSGRGLVLDITHVNGRPYLSCIDCASRFRCGACCATNLPRRSTRTWARSSPRRVHLNWYWRTTGLCRAAVAVGHVGHPDRLQLRLPSPRQRTDWMRSSNDQVDGGTIWPLHRGNDVLVQCDQGWGGPASPYEQVFGAKPRMPGMANQRREIVQTWPKLPALDAKNTHDNLERNPFVVGDEVFVKQSSDCDQPWNKPHCVSGILSSLSVTLDGADILRHVSHLRRVPILAAAAAEPLVQAASEDDDDGDNRTATCFPAWARTVPQRYGMDTPVKPNYTGWCVSVCMMTRGMWALACRCGLLQSSCHLRYYLCKPFL